MTLSPDHFRVLLGVILILGFAVALYETRLAISRRVEVCGLARQVLLIATLANFLPAAIVGLLL